MWIGGVLFYIFKEELALCEKIDLPPVFLTKGWQCVNRFKIMHFYQYVNVEFINENIICVVIISIFFKWSNAKE